MLKNFNIEKKLIYILIFAVLATFIFIFYLFLGHAKKSIQLLAPVGGEEWELTQTYKISWQARGIDKVGIVLFKGNEPQWIAKNIPAGAQSYEWKIKPGQPYGSDYWIAVFEYPWQKGNKVAYSKQPFAIVYPELGNCDTLSINNKWPYLPSDRPSLRRVFITKTAYTGNLGGLEGADQKCQEEAEKMGFSGKWHAFLGGDEPEEGAIERMKKTPRGLSGVFVEAAPAATLIRGVTCHRLLAKDFNDFLGIFSELLIVNQQKFENDFLEKLRETWIGRIDERSKGNCIPIVGVSGTNVPLAEKYSFTSTCQNWTKDNEFVQGYSRSNRGQSLSSFPSCYTPQGQKTAAVSLGGLGIGLTGGPINYNSFNPYQGKKCSSNQYLICIEE